MTRATALRWPKPDQVVRFFMRHSHLDLLIERRGTERLKKMESAMSRPRMPMLRDRGRLLFDPRDTTANSFLFHVERTQGSRSDRASGRRTRQRSSFGLAQS